jgi:DUF4097 and DUF4098 domain-containing protein YvlB
MTEPALSRRRLLGAAAAAVPAAIAGCAVPGPLETESGSRTLSLGDATSLTVENHNGRITVTGEDREDVRLDYEKRTRYGADLLDRTDVVDQRVGETLQVAVEFERNGDPTPTVRLDLRVPESTPVERLETGNGDVTARNVGGNPRLRTSNGDAVAREVGGYVSLDTSNGRVEATGIEGLDGAASSNGDVEVEIPALRQDARVETSNGDVTAALATGLDADVTAETSNGDVSTAGLSFGDAESGDSRFSGRLGEGGTDLRLSTSNGDVTLSAL